MDDVKENELLQEIRDRFKTASDAVGDENEAMLDDLNFLNGDQWPDDLQKQREVDGRPCLVINKLPTYADQVIGDIRKNSPSIKVKPVDSESDPDTAEVLTGMIRNIEIQSNAEIAYDTAAEASVHAGKGAFRIITEYADDNGFDQEIKIKRIKNPFTILWDPDAQEWDKSDARYCFLTEKIDRDKFEEQYPNAASSDFSGEGVKDAEWGSGDKIRVAEYWRVVEETSKLYLMKDPLTGATQTGEEKLDMWDVVKEREVKSRKIEWYKVSGNEILEGPIEWAGRYIPICMVYGKELNIESKTIFRGIIRHAKDPQRLYNYARSTGAETLSLAPRVPFLISSKMIGSYQQIWDNYHKKNYPYLPYEADPSLPGVIPQRTSPVQASTGVQQEVLISDQEVHDTTGLQQASLGQKSNEQSGRAILARQREGDVSNYIFYDNLARALKYAGKVILDLIPRIYDTARVVRILGEDGSDEFVRVNQPFQDEQGMPMLYDLTTGKYDVVVTVGPSYSTQREEAADSMMAFITAFPAAAPIIGDLIAKNMDWPGAQEIEKRLKMLLPPQVAGAEQGQSPLPANAPAPSPSSPLDMLKAQREQATLEGQLIDNRMKAHNAARQEMGFNEGNPSQRQ